MRSRRYVVRTMFRVYRPMGEKAALAVFYDEVVKKLRELARDGKKTDAEVERFGDDWTAWIWAEGEFTKMEQHHIRCATPTSKPKTSHEGQEFAAEFLAR